jgi:acid phosphatase family membrane protein YuiD
VLNQVIGELLDGHPVSDVKLKEVLGHTPLQVRRRRGAAGSAMQCH